MESAFDLMCDLAWRMSRSVGSGSTGYGPRASGRGSLDAPWITSPSMPVLRGGSPGWPRPGIGWSPRLISVVAAGVARLRGAVLVNWLQNVFPQVATALGGRDITGPLARGLRYLRDMVTRVILGAPMIWDDPQGGS